MNWSTSPRRVEQLCPKHRALCDGSCEHCQSEEKQQDREAAPAEEAGTGVTS
jgi:hypothetical protein